MATKNKFEDMSVLDALKYAKNQNMLLPDIQREYVWNSLKKHQNLPYSRGNLRNTTGRILCNGILTLGFILMLLFLKFRSFLMIVIVLDQLVICALQVREIHEIRKLPHSA